jgi:ATPase
MKKVIEKIVPDTSVIIEGILSAKIKLGELKPKAIIIHEAAIAELEAQANVNRESGYIGLEEIKLLREMQLKYGFDMHYSGERPKHFEIQYAKTGEIDSLIRQLALFEDATLITADKVQALVAESKGIDVILIEIELKSKVLLLEKYFDSQTMSVHIKEGMLAYAKKGMPGNWQFVKVSEEKLTREEVKLISREIIEEAGIRRDGFIEIERPGSTIVQLGRFRIVITRPPLADGWEITAVRPVKKLSLDEYQLSEQLMERVGEKAEGVLIAGAPGHGKSTFAQALAEFYSKKEKIVKTVEAPRDLVLPDEITQYAISHGTPQEIHDILLLSRPDYTIFDEMRNTEDFKLFADLRLSGVGMVGVVHATNPIDAIQRFVGRIELGVIPQIIDTVIFIKNGAVAKVLSLNMVVKVPSGMTEADLARPVVVVNDFITKKLEYELYSYGEETIVVPVSVQQKSPSRKIAEREIEKYFKEYANSAKVEVVSDEKCVVRVPENVVARIIGKQGKNIMAIEKELGIGIDVQSFGETAEKDVDSGESIGFESQITKKALIFLVEEKYINRDVKVYHQGDFVLTAKVGKNAAIKVHRKHKIGKLLIDAINMGEEIKLII